MTSIGLDGAKRLAEVGGCLRLDAPHLEFLDWTPVTPMSHITVLRTLKSADLLIQKRPNVRMTKDTGMIR